MSYYKPADHDLDSKLRVVNRGVLSGWLTPHDGVAMARLYDPDVRLCERCGQIMACCDCTVPIDVHLIEEEIRREQH